MAGGLLSAGVTVHDVLLAALARAITQFLPSRSLRGSRRRVALGTIVDTRSDAAEDLSNTFGTFLGYYVAQCRPEDSRTLADLAGRIAATTGPLKSRRGYLDSLVSMKWIGSLWPRVKPATRPHLARHAMPMTAGITNVVLRDGWIERHAGDAILGYTRAASTGPMLPLVLSPTSLGDAMSVGLSYRTTGLSRAKAAGILEAFLDELEHPHGPRLPARRKHAADPAPTTRPSRLVRQSPPG